jgi:four helix bundle protein
MTNDETRNPNANIACDALPKVYDLAERTARHGEHIVQFAKSLPPGLVMDVLVKQIVRAGTSIGANYSEADDCDSRKDFRFKIGLCRRESRETMHWCGMIADADENAAPQARILWKESHELNLIFGKIRRKTQE